MNFLELQQLDQSNEIFTSNVEEADTTELYAAALDLQASLNCEEFLGLLRSSDTWNSTKSLLEIGCGTGVTPAKTRNSKTL